MSAPSDTAQGLSDEADPVHAHDGDALEANPVVSHHNEPHQPEPVVKDSEEMATSLRKEIASVHAKILKLSVEIGKTEDDAQGRKVITALQKQIGELRVVSISLKETLADHLELQQSARVVRRQQRIKCLHLGWYDLY